MREHRTLHHVEIRASDDTPGLFEAVVMRYGTVDDYDTVFEAGCFAKSLAARLPRLTWSHDWADLVGRVVDYKDTDEALTIVGQLDLDMVTDTLPAVPRAHQAHAQLRSGTVDNFSVGFRRTSTKEVDGRTHFTEAVLDEVALVLSGAVPGTELVGVRTIPRLGREVPESLVIDLAKQVAAGELTKEAAQVALDLAAGSATPAAPSAGDGGEQPAATPAVPDPILDAADDLLGIG
jgi:HK97 family phage prohead protease